MISAAPIPQPTSTCTSYIYIYSSHVFPLGTIPGNSLRRTTPASHGAREAHNMRRAELYASAHVVTRAMITYMITNYI